MRSYFYVYHPKSGCTTFRHPEYAMVTKEAERLALNNPNNCYEVLQCLSATIKHECAGLESMKVYLSKDNIK